MYNRRGRLWWQLPCRYAVGGRSRGAPSGDATPETDAVPAANPTARIPTRGRSHPASGNPVHCSRAPARAGAVIHADLLAPGFRQPLGYDARDDVEAPAGRKRCHDADRPRRVRRSRRAFRRYLLLRVREGARKQTDHDAAANQSTANSFLRQERIIQR